MLNNKGYGILQLADVMQDVMNKCKNPLNKIYTMSSGTLLKSELGLINEDIYKETLITINEDIKRILNGISFFDKFLSNKEDIKLFNINNVLENLTSLYNHSFKKYNISIKTNYLSNSDFVGCENELTQIFICVLSSLIDILKNKSKHKIIIIKTETIKNSTKITIQTNKGSIDEVPIDISLYVSKKIVEEHYKGKFIIKNEKFTFEDKIYKGIEFNICIKNL